MLKKVAIVVGVLIVALVAYIATRPSEYKVERSTNVAAPAEVVFAQVVDFKKWDGWSPWAKLDPNMQTTFEGTPGTVGSSYSWKGSGDVGAGRMTISEIKPGQLVRIDLQFTEPFASKSDTVFTFRPASSGSTVTWAMQGTNNFMGKAFSAFMDMDGMIGKDFEKGLAAMSTVASTEAKRLEAEATAARAAAEAAAAATATAPATP